MWTAFTAVFLIGLYRDYLMKMSMLSSFIKIKYGPSYKMC